jgi:CheY-like chemotaxis protein
VLFWSYLYFATQTCQPAGWYPKPFLLIQKKFKSLHYLHNKAIGEKSKLALPELILLEFNLPRINGHEVLNYIKENEILKHIPGYYVNDIFFNRRCFEILPETF